MLMTLFLKSSVKCLINQTISFSKRSLEMRLATKFDTTLSIRPPRTWQNFHGPLNITRLSIEVSQ